MSGGGSRSVTTTRRFCARFAGVSLGATGSASARPSARMRLRVVRRGSIMLAHRFGARLRQVPVGREARRLDRRAVGEAGDEHLAPDLVQRVGDAVEHVDVAVLDDDRRRVEQAVAAQHDDRAVRLVAHRDEALLHLGLEELREHGLGGDRPRDGHARGANVVDRREELTGHVRQREAEPQVRADRDQERERRGHPQRHRLPAALGRRHRRLPVQRERTLVFAAHLVQDREQALLQRLELRAAVVDDAEASLEPERQAVVHELEEVRVLLGVLRELGQELEELLAAPRLVVERDEKAVARPHARTAPGRLRSGLVERRAHAVARAQDRLVGDAERAGARLERLHLAHQIVADLRGVGVLDRGAQLRDEVQERIGGRHQRVRPAQQDRPFLDDGHARRRGLRRCGFERIFPGHGGERFTACSRCHYARIAQNSSFNPGNSPAMCIARPPEDSSWRQSSFLVSSSK